MNDLKEAQYYMQEGAAGVCSDYLQDTMLTDLSCRHYEMVVEDYYSCSCSGMNKGKDIRSKKNFNRI